MIRVLEGGVVDRIAAGEVVERPASVLKELVENSLDAGAREISVEFESGGVKRIEVADDGEGMDPDEALLSLQRHATSKIETERDLLEVATFGFRGEALPSIAAVSRLTLLTRRRGATAGTRVTIEGGDVLDRSPAGVPEGTRLRVQDLFWNTPARLKFLKTERTETARLVETFRHLAVTRPGVAFSLFEAGEEILSLPAARDAGERVQKIHPRLSLPGFHEQSGGIEVEGWLAEPGAARPGAQGLVIVVNGRVVTDRGIAGAIAAAHEGLLPQGRYPQGVVLLTVPRVMVDVNVHPGKREVRFSDPRMVSAAVHRAVSRWARTTPWIGARTSLRPPPPEVPSTTQLPSVSESTSSRYTSRHGGFIARTAAAIGPSPIPHRGTGIPLPLPVPAAQPESRGTFSSLVYAGQVLGTYLVCEGVDGIVLVDQHAAAERVTFERLRQQWRSGSVASQVLLMPVRVDVDAVRAALVEENEGLLRSFGLGAELSGPDSVTVREVPMLLSGSDPARLLADVLAEIEDSRGRLDTIAEEVLSRMACHASLRGGDRIDAERAIALLRDLDRVDWAGHCPHGRPVSFELPRSEIERRFRR